MSKTNRDAVLADINYLTGLYRAEKDEAMRANYLRLIYRREAELRG